MSKAHGFRKWAGWLGMLLLALFVLAQVIRPDRTNPRAPPQDDIVAQGGIDATTHAVLEKACNDCHSNATRWPWYSHVAPISWLVSYDVNEGRAALNFSEWARHDGPARAKVLHELCEQVSEGEMPPLQYRLLHPAARLNAAERQQLCDWATRLPSHPAEAGEEASVDAWRRTRR